MSPAGGPEGERRSAQRGGAPMTPAGAAERLPLQALVDAQAGRLQTAGVSFGHGTQDAGDEAAWLVLWALGLPLDSYDEHAGDVLGEAQVRAATALVDRRIAERVPAAYLIREAWLQGVAFYIDERAIVPRSLIAELIADGGFDAWLSPATRHVLDLCTGNGSLAVLAALAWPDVQVDATDLSADALAVAAINVERHGLSDRIRLAAGDGYAAVDALPSPVPRYDLVLCNPPYVNDRSMAALPAEYRAEPSMALAGGADGMDFVRRLLRESASRMSDDAVLVLEIGHERDHFERAFPRLPVVWLATSGTSDAVLLATRADLSAYPF